MFSEEEQGNYATFRDCLSDTLIQQLTSAETPRQRKRGSRRKSAVKPVSGAAEGDKGDRSAPPSDAEELSEFIEYLAIEIFSSLPADLRSLSYSAIQNNAALSTRYSTPLSSTTTEALLASIPPSATDSLTAYLTASDDPLKLLIAPLEAYISSVTSPPPIWSTTRAEACEICERSYIPLTYHHLIPRAVHAKSLKRGWHEEWQLNKVAWLCRACHSFVHRVASNETLAREYDTVEKLMEREDVQNFARWVGRVRWKAR